MVPILFTCIWTRQGELGALLYVLTTDKPIFPYMGVLILQHGHSVLTWLARYHLLTFLLQLLEQITSSKGHSHLCLSIYSWEMVPISQLLGQGKGNLEHSSRWSPSINWCSPIMWQYWQLTLWYGHLRSREMTDQILSLHHLATPIWTLGFYKLTAISVYKMIINVIHLTLPITTFMFVSTVHMRAADFSINRVCTHVTFFMINWQIAGFVCQWSKQDLQMVCPWQH